MTKQLFGGTLRAALVHAVTEFDRKQSKRKDYNHYALAQYLMRIDDIESDIANGANVRDAILAGLTGRLCDHVLKAVGESKFTTNEMRSQGYVYSPVSRKESTS